MDKDCKGQRKLDSGGGLLPAMEGHSLEWNKTEIVVIDTIVSSFVCVCFFLGGGGRGGGGFRTICLMITSHCKKKL